jgi:hypothetical protein
MRRSLIGLIFISLGLAGALFVANGDAPITADAAVRGGGVISVKCAGGSKLSQTDPIVSPGVPSAHLHQFVGGIRAADAPDTSAASSDVVRAGPTTCPISQDTAGYWFPPLANKSTGAVKAANQMNAYYRSPGGVDVTAWPEDFTMVAGIGTPNVPPSTITQKGVSWSCVDSGPFSPEPINCPNALIAHVHFPDCQLADGRLTYGVRDCAVHFPKLSMHIRYKITNGSQYALVPGTMGLHADFWNTWDQVTLSGLVENCLDGGLDCKGMAPGNVLTRCKCEQP